MDDETEESIKTVFGYIIFGAICWGVYYYVTTPFTPAEQQAQFAAYLQGK